MNEVMAFEEFEKSLPKGIHLYDFGDGVKLMPTPDPSGVGYLASSTFYLYSMLPNGKMACEGVEITYKLGSEENVVTIRKEELDKAVAKFQADLAKLK